MEEKPNALSALWKSKKYVTTVVWAFICLTVGSKSPDKTVAVGCLACASAVICAYLFAQGYVDAHRSTNGG